MRLKNVKTVVFIAAGLIAFLLYLGFFVGFDSLFALVSRLNFYNYFFYFSLAILAFFLSFIFDSLIWHSLLEALSVKVKLRKIFFYNWIGNFIELIIPSATVGGEVARIALAQKDIKNDTGIAAATVISSRMVSSLIYFGGLIIGTISLVLTHQFSIYLFTPVILVSAGTAAIMGVIIFVALKEGETSRVVNAIMKIVNRLIKNPLKRINVKNKIEQSLVSFSQSFRVFKSNPKLLIKPLIYGVFSWFFAVIMYLMFFYSLNFTSISIIDLGTVFCFVTTVETVTAGVPVGAVELTMINLFALYGVPLAVAGVVTTLSRLLTFWCQILVGYPLVQWFSTKAFGKKLSGLSFKFS